MDDVKEKKTRQRLTTTAVIDAIDEMYRATLTEEQQEHYVFCSIHLRKQHDRDSIEYIAAVLAHPDIGEEGEHVDECKSRIDYDDALALLLEKMKTRLEDHKKVLLASVENVLSKHRGALKGARSKIRENKA